MGGAHTEISGETKNVIIESAYFQPASIRRTSKRFGLSTEASQRFERGCDPDVTVYALNRARKLILEVAGGRAAKGVIDAYPRKISPKSVRLSVKATNELLGTNLGKETIIRLLKGIEIKREPTGRKKEEEFMTFRVPTFRPDITREADLIEEVARLHGYDKISTDVTSRISFTHSPAERLPSEAIREWLVGGGYHELVVNSMQERAVAGLSGENLIQILNPVSQDMAALRTSMIPGLLQIARNNIFHGTPDVRAFEIGKIFRYDPQRTNAPIPGYVEEEHLAILWTGTAALKRWDAPARKYDIFDVKGEIQTLFKKIFLDKFKFIPYPTTKPLTEEGLLVEIQGEIAGELGRVRKEMLNRFEIEQDVFVADLRLDALTNSVARTRKFTELPKYPAVNRDLAFVLHESTPSEEVIREIRRSAGSLLVSADLFDIYHGDQLRGGQKSLAFTVTFQSGSHTLTQAEIDEAVQRIIVSVEKKFEASLRS
jgi:phenylalanyl-tRNA synthetase beta chain